MRSQQCGQVLGLNPATGKHLFLENFHFNCVCNFYCYRRDRRRVALVRRRHVGYVLRAVLAGDGRVVLAERHLPETIKVN